MKIRGLCHLKAIKEVTALKNNGMIICWNTFKLQKKGLEKKITFLIEKFKPLPRRNPKKVARSIRRKILVNKNSRDRYKVKAMTVKLSIYQVKFYQSTTLQLWKLDIVLCLHLITRTKKNNY